jgi:hypothetical protein
MRRIRLVASLMTLLVVASVSLVVYALVPFRAVTDRHAGGKASAPAHPVMTAPSHPDHSSPPGKAAQASAAPASASPALGASAAASSAASQAPSDDAGTSASPASAPQQSHRTRAQ